MNLTLVVLAAVAGSALVLTLAGTRIIKEYQRGVVFRLGRITGSLKRPGARLVIPLVDRVLRVDLRTVSFEVPPQEVISKDNVMVTVRAVAYIQVVNPRLAVTKVANHVDAARQLVQSSLRSTLGQVTLAELLTARDTVNALLDRVINTELEAWGIALSAIELKDVQLSESMLRALGREAEAELESKAKLASAEGELATMRALADAAGTMADSPTLLQLRYLQTLTQIGNDRSTVVVFPLPLDLVQPLLDMQARLRRGRDGGGDGSGQHDIAQPDGQDRPSRTGPRPSEPPRREPPAPRYRLDLSEESPPPPPPPVD